MAWPGGLLVALGARFPDPALERQYREFRIAQHFLKDDGMQVAMRTALIGAMAVRSVFNTGPMAGAAAAIGMLLTPLAQLLMQSVANRKGRTEAAMGVYLLQRNAMAVLSRLLLHPLYVCAYFSDYFPPPGASATWPRLATHLFIGSGAVVPFVASMAYPVLLEHHLAMQPLVLVIFARWRIGPYCREALASDNGPENVLAAWRAVEAASGWVLRHMYFGEVPAAPEPDPLPACGHVALAVFLCAALAATTYLAWLTEHNSRIDFLTVGSAGWMGWAPLGRRAFLFQLVMAAACLAVAWQALGVLLLLRPGGPWEGGGVGWSDIGLECDHTGASSV